MKELLYFATNTLRLNVENQSTETTKPVKKSTTETPTGHETFSDNVNVPGQTTKTQEGMKMVFNWSQKVKKQN